MNRLTLLLAIGTGLPSASLAADPEPVSFTGGFQAEAHREIETGSGRKALVYSVLGSIMLGFAGESPRAVSAECLGFDENGVGAATAGTGRCLWRDGDGDRLYVTIATAGSGNVYTVTGGTGKWIGAAGELRTTFAYLPAPEGTFLIAESGNGRLTRPNR
jgi:hypothetical protein